MALLKRGKSKRLVLDVGSSAIRLCELSPTKAGYQLTKYYQREVLTDPAADPDERRQHRQQILDALLKESKIRTKKTIMAVPGQSVFTRNRPLPPVPEYKVTQIVRYEIQQQIPFSLDQIALDYQVLDRTESGGYDVMMAAIKVDVVEKSLEILEKTKRSIDVVDVAPLAAYNWLRHTGEFGDTGECVALIDLGATTTDIVIQKDNQFRFTRSLNIGGNDITKAIAAGFNMTFEDAEKVKRERGFAPTGNPEKDGKGGEVIGNVLNRLATEITRSFAYFRSQPGGGPTARVIVTGGGACLRNIVPFLQRALAIEVRIAQPLAGLAVAPQASEASEHPEQACVVLGLALRCCENVPIQINLIPPRVLESARRKEQIFYWVLSITTLFLIMASIIPVTAAKDELVQEEIQTLERVLAGYDAAIVNDPVQRSEFETKYGDIKAAVNASANEVRNLDTVHNLRKFWLDYLKAVNDARPESGGITISSIETAVIGGNSNTGDAARNKANGQQPQAQAAAAQPAPGGDGGGMLGSLGAAMATAGRGRGGGDSYDARGFPGIYPTGDFASMGNVGGFGGAGGGSRRNQAPAKGPTVVEPNSLIIYGYAADTDTLELYVDRLRERKEFIQNGIYFHVSEANEVPETDLDKAQVGGKDIGASGGGRRRSGGGGGDDSGGLGGLGGIGGAIQVSGGGGALRNNPFAARVVSFRIDVQFLGDTVPQPGSGQNA